MHEDPRIGEPAVHESQQDITSGDLEKIVDHVTALQFIGDQVVAKLTPVPYGGETFENNPQKREIPAKDVSEIIRVIQDAITAPVRTGTSPTGTLSLDFHLARLANSYEERDFSQQPMNINEAVIYIDYHKLTYNNKDSDQELISIVMRAIKTKLREWSDEKTRVRTTLDEYALALSHLSNQVLVLRHAPVAGQGSNQDYGSFTIIVNQSELQRFLTKALEIKAQHAQLKQPVVAPAVQHFQDEDEDEANEGASPADVDATVTGDEKSAGNLVVEHEPQRAPEQEPIKVEAEVVAADNDPAQTDGREADPMGVAGENEKPPAQDEAYWNAPTIFELRSELAKLAAAEFKFTRTQAGTRKPIEVTASEYLGMLDRLIELMAVGDWTTVLLSLESKQLYKQHLSAVIQEPLTRIIEQNYKREKELVLLIAQQATNAEQAAHILRNFRDASPNFLLSGGIGLDGKAKPDHRFAMNTVIEQLREGNLQNSEVKLACRLMPKLLEFFSPVQNTVKNQVEARGNPNTELSVLRSIFYKQIGPENNPAAQGLAESLANQLVNQFVSGSRDSRTYYCFVLMKTQIAKYRDTGIYFTEGDKQYDMAAVMNYLSTLIASGSNNSLHTQNPENYPKVLGIRPLVRQVLANGVNMHLYVKEVQGDDLLITQQRKTSEPEISDAPNKPWYKFW